MPNRTLRVAFILLAWALTALLPPPAPAQTAAGWKTEIVGKTVVMTPPDLAAGEDCRITVYAREPLNGALITDFLDGFADRTVKGLGKPGGKPAPAQATDRSNAAATRQFTAAHGQATEAVFFALSPDRENARVVSFVCTADPAVLGRYQAQMLAVVKEMTRQESDAAVSSGRGVVTETLPDAPPGLTPGGPMTPGIYAGNIVQTKTINREQSQEIYARVRLSLYADGEFRLCHADGTEIDFGTGDSFYDRITGRLKIGSGFKMACFKDPANGYCLYGRGADGKPCLMARETQTFGEWVTVLHWIGPPDRPSPKQAAAKKAADDAEAKRYKFVAAPGKGVQAGQIAAVLFHTDMVMIGNNYSAFPKTYLALKDGTVHDGLEVPAETLDVSQSRRGEPEKWGRWQKRGEDYWAAWPDKPGHYDNLNAYAITPAKPGEKLTGYYLKGISGGDIATGGFTVFWGVSFRPDGHFLKSHSSSESTGYLALQNSGVVSGGASGDDGSSTYSFSPQVTATSETKTKGPARSGTYSLSGYTLTLRYDDGRVEREPFYFLSPSHDFICFEGGTMNLQK